MEFEQKDCYGINDLLAIMELLRSDQGCPWDREQTHESIRKNLLEEAWEVAEAIDTGDTLLLREELGDLLLQIVFHTVMEREAGSFSFDDVCDGICQKLIRRHPHIFEDTAADTAEQVLANWDEIKRTEKAQTSYADTLRSVPGVLPALMKSEKIQKRAARSGFDYPDLEQAMDDLCSELVEFQDALREQDAVAVEEELGDFLFSVVNVARFAGADPEESLSKACSKFVRRFTAVEQMAIQQGIDMKHSDMDTLNALWQEAKNKEC